MTKSCTLCSKPQHILVRCQIDETQKWHFVCTGACWKSVSGGVEDAKGLKDEFPHYRYGGMWKDRSADGPISAKKSRKVKERQKEELRKREANSHDHEHDETDEHDVCKKVVPTA